MSLLKNKVQRSPALLVFIEDSKTFYVPDLSSSHDNATFLIVLLFPRVPKKPSRDIGMLRSARDDVSIPGNVFDCQHARRVSDELHK